MKHYPVQATTWSPLPLNGSVEQCVQPGKTPIRPRSGILEAVQGKKLDVVMKIVEENPNVVNEKGFVGLQPLHKAALHGDSSVVEYLLQNKANPNCTNDFEETPLHYACKRGDLVIFRMLVDAGADIEAEDKAGRGLMHHTANGGSGTMFHYLTDIMGLSTHVRDKNMNTPLHLVCSHGHIEALKYLLKKERSDVFAADCAGNTALHIAATSGHGWSCWMLLSVGGLSLLHLTNRDDHRPLDMALQGNSVKFRDIVTLLTFYTNKISEKSGRVRGPVLAWYFLLLAPVIFYPLILLLSMCTPYPGFITVIGLAALGMFLFQQEHRIRHLSRWPNPTHVGLFVAGMGYTVLCYFIVIAPYIYDSRPWFVFVTCLLTMLVLYLYVLLMFFRDPGECRESSLKSTGVGRYTLRDIASGEVRLQAFCSDCEVIPPSRTHHCKMCNKCYYNLDHHCLFLYGCVATSNHRLFVGFIACCLVNMVLFLYISVAYLAEVYVDQEFDSKLILHIFNTQPWLWSMVVANAVSVIWGIVLLRFQLNVISKGHTTAFQPNMGKSSLGWSQRSRNVVHFLLGKNSFTKDSMFVC